MKIAYFSPLPPLKSGISDYSELIITELAKYAEVDLWVDGYEPAERLASQFTIIDYVNAPEKLDQLAEYHTIIYNMGNNLDYHGNIFEVMCRYNGIVILHDYVLHDFFMMYWINCKKQPINYVREMYLNCGEEGKKIAEKSLNGEIVPVWETDEKINFPLNKKIIQNAYGVIVHSNFVKTRIINNTSVPVVQINHPYFEDLYKNGISRSEMKLPSDKIILFSLGDLVPNKRLDKVLGAIASDEFLKNNCLYVCAGKENENFNIREVVSKLGLQDVVRITGRLSLEDVYNYLSVADICLNLRFPTMGETSGSVIRLLHMGKPTLVTKTGWYDELPDDCVVKVEPANEVEELRIKLKWLIEKPIVREKIAYNAHNYLKENFSVQNYVSRLLDFGEEVSRKKAYYQLAGKISDELFKMGVRANDGLIEGIIDKLDMK